MSIQIHIEDDWYITSDKHGYQLTLFSGYDKHGQEKWSASKFAGTIRTILEVWAEQMIKDSNAQTFRELKAKIDELHKKIDQIGRRSPWSPIRGRCTPFQGFTSPLVGWA